MSNPQAQSAPTTPRNTENIDIVEQFKTKINEASEHLKKNTTYYEHWSKENLDDVVNWRFKD